MNSDRVCASSGEAILCCVSSFLQYLNVIEYVLRFHEDSDKHLIVYMTEQNKQLKRFVDRNAGDNFECIKYIEKEDLSFRRNPVKSFFKIYSQKKKLKEIVRSTKYAKLVIGHSSEAFYQFGYLSSFFSRGGRFVIVDDGTKTSLFLSDEEYFQNW